MRLWWTLWQIVANGGPIGRIVVIRGRGGKHDWTVHVDQNEYWGTADDVVRDEHWKTS